MLNIRPGMYSTYNWGLDMWNFVNSLTLVHPQDAIASAKKERKVSVSPKKDKKLTRHVKLMPPKTHKPHKKSFRFHIQQPRQRNFHAK